MTKQEMLKQAGWDLNGKVIKAGGEKEYLLKLIEIEGIQKFSDEMDWDLNDFVLEILNQPADQELYEVMMEQLGAKRK